MKYKILLTVILIFIFSIKCFSQDLKLKKSELKYLMEDLRLRKKSLEMEREYLMNFLQSIKDLDSLRNELNKCKELEDSNRNFNSNGKKVFY